MKRLIPFMALALSLVLVFAGCGKTEKAPEVAEEPAAEEVATQEEQPETDAEETEELAVYRAEMSDAYAEEEGHGWKGFVEVTMDGDKPATVNFDYTNAEGALKSEASKEEYPMDPPPSEWLTQLEQSALNAESADDIDAIAGATSSSEEFSELLAAALEAAQKGETAPVVLH